MSTSSLVLQSYLFTANTDTKDKSRYEQEVAKLLQYNEENKGGDFLTPLSFYLGILEDTDPVLFPYLTEKQKNHTLRDLQVTYLLLLVEKKYELEHQKTENSALYAGYLKKCQQLIDKINYEKACEAQQIIPSPEHDYNSDGKTVAYLGIFFGQALAEQMVSMANRQTKTIKDGMGWVNEKRLYWVWASSFLKTTMDLLPDNFFNSGAAKQNIRTPDPYTGTMSWALYYFRFSLNLSLLLKHTISGPWMSEKEKSTPWTERFMTQWDQRKFSLLNDFVWATGNLVCFFWLCGKGAAGTWGDMLTIALLVFDITLSVWDFEEQKTRHFKAVLDYETAIKKLGKDIAALSDTDENERKQKIELRIQLSALERAKSQCEREWSYQKINLATNITYAVGLMVAFVLLAAPFLPLAAATLAAMTIAGAVLCFAFSVINNCVKASIDIHKTKITIKEQKADYAKRVLDFKNLISENPEADENVKKIMFLEVKKLIAETQYQEEMLNFHTIKLIRSLLIESLVPPLVFLSFVFLPLGPALGVLAAAVALAMVTHFLINACFKPEKEELKELDEKDYLAFCDDPDNWGKKGHKALTFFQPQSEEPGSSIVSTDTRLDERPEDDDSIPLLSAQ